MNKQFGWKEWDTHLLHFIGKPIKILEIGVFKGQAMEKFAEIFLESNNDAEYYGIDTWEGSPEYVEIDFKEIEKSANDKKNNSTRKNNIHFIKKESVIALPELIIKNITFDIIFVDASHTAKDVLYDGVTCMKLLNINGIIIFDDYLWQKLEPIIFTPKPAIDSILNIFKDELDVLYVGYQVIAKRVNVKFLPKQTDKTIIDGFINLLNKYWIDNDIKEYGIIFNLKELPTIKPVYDDFKNIKIRKLDSIEIFKKLNLNHLMFKYLKLSELYDEIKNKQNNFIQINKLKKIYDLSQYNLYSLINLLNDSKLILNNYDSISEILLDKYKINDLINFYKNNFKILYNKDITISIIDIKEINNKEKINNLFTKIKKDNIKTDRFNIISTVKYLDYSKIYNNILLQILILKYTLKDGGFVEINIEIIYNFINDLLILLNHIFDKIKIYIISNKIGRLTIKIIGSNFLGIDDNLFNQIYEIITNTDKEIISIFTKTNLYINTDLLENTIFDQTKKIISFIIKNEKIIIQNINKINTSIKTRTINHIMTYVIK